jgi:VIT1/CCC1 family predicted Fe2+/Mn2+ transporter
MAERTAERTRSSDGDAESTDTTATDAIDTSLGSLSDEATDTEAESGGSYFSVRALIVAFGAIGGGMTLGSLVPMIPFTAFAGIPAGAFLHGLLDRERRYAETAVAGGLLAGLAVITSLLPQVLAGLNGTRLFAIAAAVGLVLSVVGHYFGRDLRDGLTRDI